MTDITITSHLFTELSRSSDKTIETCKMNILLSIFSILVYVNTRRTWLALKMELRFVYRISHSRLVFGIIVKHESKWKSLVGSFSWFTCFKSSSHSSLLYGIKINGFMPSRWPCNCSELNFAKIIFIVKQFTIYPPCSWMKIYCHKSVLIAYSLGVHVPVEVVPCRAWNVCW